MDERILLKYLNQYKKNLLEDVVPFWESHSLDKKYGGYFTCLDRDGSVYDTDKFMWLQGRQIWTFSMLFNQVEKKQTWLDIAENGIRFLKKYGSDENGSFYFSCTEDGLPLTHAFNIYSDCFAALGFHEYAKATGNSESMDLAIQTYQQFISRLENPKGKFEKTTGNRPIRSFGLPMMTAYLTYEMEEVIGKESTESIYENCINLILNQYRHPKTGLIHEFIGRDGSFLNTYEGRLLNPGHAIEAMWFLMDIAIRLGRKNLIEKCTDQCLHILNYAWDQEHDGIFYFMDSKGAPPQQLEWDQKLWWVHLEALIALSKAFYLTQRKDVWEWYEKVHKYTWERFPDPKNGEWFGYLNREGKPHLTLKGGKWKGCFHVPRALYECWQNFEKIHIESQHETNRALI